jgi:hypothetical protein
VSHYETLGVAHDASAAEIRSAYLARARRHHPDVASSDAGSSSMVDLNAAYDTLRDPVGRRVYDRALAEAAARDSGGPDDHDGGDDLDVDSFDPDTRPSNGPVGHRVLTPSGPAKMPWRLMAVTAVIGSLVVLVSAAFTDSPADEPPDGILRVGSCVVVEPNFDVREVACDDAPELVVRLMLPTGSTCPQPYATHRDRLGLGTACVESSE